MGAEPSEHCSRIAISNDVGILEHASQYFDDLAFPECLRAAFSTRLDNALSNAIPRVICLYTIGDVLRSLADLEHQLIRLPNLGRKSLSEFKSALHACCVRRFSQLGLSNGDAERLAETLWNLSPSPNELEAARSLLERLPPVETVRDQLTGRLPQAAIPNNLSPESIVKNAVSALPEREQQIIARRFGFEGRPPATLEEIGRELGVTRERVRQIESKAIRRAHIEDFSAQLNEALKRAETPLWCALTGGLDLLTWSRLREQYVCIPGEITFARNSMEFKSVS